MSLFKATKGPQLLRRDPEYTQGQGWSIAEVWRGGKSEIFGLADQLISDGYEFTIDPDPPYYNLTARKQAQSESFDQVAADRFRVHKENIDKSVWSLDSVQTEMASFGADYRRIIEEAVETGEGSLALEDQIPELLWPIAHQVVIELARGATHYEDEYTVLTRERIVGNNFAAKLDLQGSSTIYTTGELISEFAIPTFAHVLLPVDPASTPTDTLWGWRSRKYEVNYIQGQKATQLSDWVFAAWSTNLYTAFT